MKIIALIIALVVPSVVRSSDSESVAQLFDLLDQNGDGTVTMAEISDNQKPYFLRALRVADLNEDSQLTREELQVALTAPQPIEPVSQGRRDGFDVTRLDRNGDGKISRDEVPEALKQQFERAFQQLGDPLSIKALREMRSVRTTPTSETPNADSKSKASDSGKLMTPRRGASQRAPASADQLFDRLDRNGDGSLSSDEVPQVIRQNLRRSDRDGDKSISREEFRRMTERQQQNSR
ncbi:MAG: hypothetical protein R3C59_02705 [Planctomycetaceae bacterium]